MSNMSVEDVIKHYQRSIEKCQGNHERMLHCISKLYRLPVTVQHLQDTGIGRTVNNLRKYEGDTGEAAKALVAKWKAMVAAEDSSEGEEQENNQQDSIEEEDRHHKEDDHHRSNKHRSHYDREKIQHKEKSHHETDRSHYDRGRSHHDREKSQHSRERSHSDRDRLQYEKEKSHHNKKHDVSEKSKKSSSHEQSKKRKYEEENGKKSEKRKRRHETESESSESEENLTVEEEEEEEEDDSGHDSEDQSTSQTSQNVEEDSSDEEPVPQKHKNHISTKEHRSKSHSSSKGHSSNKEHLNNKEHRSSKEYVSSKSQSSHRKDKDKSKQKTENSDRKDEKRKEDNSKKQKSASHIPENKHSSKIKKEKAEGEDGSIDCSTGASFAEALGMVDPIVKKKQHTSTSSPSTSSASRSNKSSSSSKKKDTSNKSSPGEFNLLAPNVKLEPLEVDLDATLPPITPNYKPLPHYNLLDSPPHRKVKQLTEEEALSQVMSTKNQRTKVYSGVKSGKSWATIPTLYDICVRVLQENIDALEYTGGVPYDLLKPVLQHANPEQLFMLEHHNPYLIDDTDELWKFHCQKEFRTKQRQDMETSREMYLRCLDEREAKLKALTSNIQQSIAKSTPVRQTKLAYVDSVAKPPRNVARQQAKYGIANKIIKPSPAAKASTKANAVAASSSAVGVSVPPPRPIQTVTKQKPRMAPLMQKTMKLVKSFKR